MTKYIINISNTSFLEISGDAVKIDNGCLSIMNQDVIIAAFAAGGWVNIRIKNPDDSNDR